MRISPITFRRCPVSSLNTRELADAHALAYRLPLALIEGYLRLAARSRISEEELDRYLTELERRKDKARRELAGLRDRRELLSELEELAGTVEEYLGDLPQLIHGGQIGIV